MEAAITGRPDEYWVILEPRLWQIALRVKGSHTDGPVVFSHKTKSVGLCGDASIDYMVLQSGRQEN